MIGWTPYSATRLWHSADLDDMAEALDDPQPTIQGRYRPKSRMGNRPTAQRDAEKPRPTRSAGA